MRLKKLLLVLVLLTLSNVVLGVNRGELAQYIRLENPKTSYSRSMKIAKAFQVESERYNIPLFVLVAIANIESHFRDVCRRELPAGFSCGVTQVNSYVWLKRSNPDNLYRKGIVKRFKDLRDPVKNIRAGAYILNYKRGVCKQFKKNGTFKKRGFKDLVHCYVSRYNGDTTNAYYLKWLRAAVKFLKFSGKY